jgi:IclR family acetate operon transcriptional repressor
MQNTRNAPCWYSTAEGVAIAGYDSSVQNERPDGRKPPGYPIASVDNALTLLSLFREHDRLRVSDAAEALGASRSTAHRLLAMLEYHRFARQDPATKAYLPGPALIEVGLSALGRMDIRTLARPALERLSDEVQETVHLVVLQDGSAMFLDSVETSRSLRIGSRLGRTMPAHCTAAGKAMLAQMDSGELHRLYPDGRLERLTPQSLSTMAALESELAAVRERGFATNFGQSEADVAAVAVAVPAQAGHPRAAITVSAPITRLSDDDAPRIAEAARRAAAAVAERVAAPEQAGR